MLVRPPLVPVLVLVLPLVLPLVLALVARRPLVREQAAILLLGLFAPCAVSWTTRPCWGSTLFVRACHAPPLPRPPVLSPRWCIPSPPPSVFPCAGKPAAPQGKAPAEGAAPAAAPAAGAGGGGSAAASAAPPAAEGGKKAAKPAKAPAAPPAPPAEDGAPHGPCGSTVSWFPGLRLWVSRV
jgi:hypothetical protein